jgi:hypothetical protein
VHLVGERSRDVLEAAAIRLVIRHGTILAASPAPQCVDDAAGVRGSDSTVSTRRSTSLGRFAQRMSTPVKFHARRAPMIPVSTSLRL